MQLKTSRARVAVAAATVALLSLTSGCLIGGGQPPAENAQCSAANVIRLQADLDATQALIQEKRSALETAPQELVPAIQSALTHLESRADWLQGQLNECGEGESPSLGVS